MLVWEIIFLSLALATDAAAISLSNTLCYSPMRFRYKLLTPLSFAFFQGIMPLLGYFLLRDFNFQSIGKILTFAIFLFLGGNMLYNSLFSQENKNYCPSPFTVGVLLFQSVTTSIDAFTVGISFAAERINPMPIVWAIIAITFIICFAAIKLGNLIHNTIDRKASLVGAVLLIVLSIKSLF